MIYFSAHHLGADEYFIRGSDLKGAFMTFDQGVSWLDRQLATLLWAFALTLTSILRWERHHHPFGTAECRE